MAEFFIPQNKAPWGEIPFIDTLWHHRCPFMTSLPLLATFLLCLSSVESKLLACCILCISSIHFTLTNEFRAISIFRQGHFQEGKASLRWSRIHFCIMLQHTNMDAHFQEALQGRSVIGAHWGCPPDFLLWFLLELENCQYVLVLLFVYFCLFI